MKLKLTLLAFCLLGIGIFSQAQDAKTAPPKPKFRAPKDAPRDQDGNLLPPPPPPKVDLKHFKAPKGGAADKNGNFVDPPPPPPLAKPPAKAEEEFDKYGNPVPPPPPPPAAGRTGIKFRAPKGAPRDKDGNLLPPPPPPVEKRGGHTNTSKEKPVNANTPPQHDERS